jgi:hypothetical protein
MNCIKCGNEIDVNVRKGRGLFIDKEMFLGPFCRECWADIYFSKSWPIPIELARKKWPDMYGTPVEPN